MALSTEANQPISYIMTAEVSEANARAKSDAVFQKQGVVYCTYPFIIFQFGMEMGHRDPWIIVNGDLLIWSGCCAIGPVGQANPATRGAFMVLLFCGMVVPAWEVFGCGLVPVKTAAATAGRGGDF